MNTFIILLSLAIWGLVHSVLASHFTKDMVRGTVGRQGMRLYRLGYNIFSVLSFAPVLYFSWTLPTEVMYAVPSPWNLVMFGGQLIAALCLLAAFLQTDSLAFMGLKQLFVEDEDSGPLVTRGLYRMVRHPLYTFSLLFVWLTPVMSKNSLVLYLGVTLYVLIGAYFEERKMLRDYGAAYEEYKRRTPMLVPGLRWGVK